MYELGAVTTKLRANIIYRIIKCLLALSLLILTLILYQDRVIFDDKVLDVIKYIFPFILVAGIILSIVNMIRNEVVICEIGIIIKKAFSSSKTIMYNEIDFFYWQRVKSKILWIIPAGTSYILYIIGKEQKILAKASSEKYYKFYNRMSELERELIDKGIIKNGMLQERVENYIFY